MTDLPPTCAIHSAQLVELRDDVKLIKNAILGDGYGNPGYRQRIEHMEVEVDKLRNAMVRLDIRVSVVAASVSAAAFLVKHLLF